ncbi:MAG TPA: outer membrane beta-barrel protein, partial [Flavitalea sp.]|nr:outer membrane beta-barrel protein [Flavitalea sp.]
MKNLLLSVVLLSITHISMCQVQGKVLTGTGQPVVQASVRLLHASDSSIIKSGLSNNEGIFKLNHSERGKYVLQISSIGFITWSLMIEMPMPGDIGAVVLKEDLQQLAAVTVKGTKPLFQQSAFGMTINVERDMLSKGSSVLQVLERSPGVVIDHRNNSIALNGKSGVMIMLNGKLMRLPMDQVTRLLNGMSADEVVSIELLTTPPASYDAEGSAGLINIITRKSKKQGLTGSVSISGGYGKKEKNTTGFNLTRTAKKTDWYGSYSWSRKYSYSDLFIISGQNMPVLGGQMEVISSTTTQILRKTHDVSAGIDSRPDSTIKLGASIIFNGSAADSKDHTQAVYAVVPDSLLLFNGTVKGENRWRNIIASAYASKQLRNSGVLRLDLDYLQFTNHNPTQVYNSFLKSDSSIAGSNNDTLFSPLQQGFANTTIRAGVAQLAYNRQLNPKTKIESGIKWNTTQVSSESGIASQVNGSWAGRNETTNSLAMNESIGAVFVSVSTPIDSSTRLTAGT